MGAICLGLFLMMIGRSALLFARDVLGRSSGVPSILSACVLAWTATTVGGQILGSVGMLTRAGLLGFAGTLLAASSLWSFRKLPRSAHTIPAIPPATRWDLIAIVSLGFLITSCVMIGVPSYLLPTKIVSDGPIYHLFFAAKWWKAGRIFLVASPFGESAATYFPANGDVWFSILMTLFGGDRFAKVGQAPFLWMSGIAAYGIARRLGASGSSALIATCWAVSSFPLLLFSFESNVDTIFLAGYLASTYFFVLYALDGHHVRELVLAGLCAGLAWGTKPTATAFIPPLLLVGGWLVVVATGSFRGKFRHLGALTLATGVPCGFWFARNWILTSNPLYPLHLEALEIVWLKGWYRSADMVKSQFFLPINDWRSFVAIVTMVLDPRLVPGWMLAWFGAWYWGRVKQPLDRWVWLIACLSLLNIAIYWLAIPYRTQQRFMLQALGLGVTPLALLFDRSVILRLLGALFLVVHLTTSQSWLLSEPGKRAFWEISERIPALAAPAPIESMISPAHWRQMMASPRGLEYVATTIGSIAACFGMSFLWTWAASRRTSKAWGIAWVSSGLFLVGFGFQLDSLSGKPSLRIYPPFEDYQQAWSIVESVSPPEGTRIAYAGTNLPFILMGGRSRNDLFYINIDAHPDWLLHDYHLSAQDRGDPEVWPGPRPGWDRIHPDYEAWRANLHRARISLLVVAKANPNDGAFNLADEERFPIERVWADAHPETFTKIYPQQGEESQMRVYRLNRRKE